MRRVSFVLLLIVLAACSDDRQVELEAPSSSSAAIEQSEGYEYYQQQGCIACHGDALQGGSGPALTSQSLSATEIERIIVEGKGFMPPQQVDTDILTELSTWLSEQ